MTKLKSNYILDLVNEITLIHNSFQKGDLFSATFNLCFLQQCLLDIMRELEEREVKHEIPQKLDNPVWCDVWKFYTAISSDTCADPFYTQDYIMEKLMRILNGESIWHQLVEDAFKELKEREKNRKLGL